MDQSHKGNTHRDMTDDIKGTNLGTIGILEGHRRDIFQPEGTTMGTLRSCIIHTRDTHRDMTDDAKGTNLGTIGFSKGHRGTLFVPKGHESLQGTQSTTQGHNEGREDSQRDT